MSNDGDAQRNLRGLAVAAPVLLVVWSLYPLGLYTDPGQFAAMWHATAALALAFVLGHRERRPFVFSPARVAGLALWVAYLLSALLAAALPREAVQEVLKQGLYLAVFLAVSETVRSAVAVERFDAPEGTPGRQGRHTLAGPAGIALGLWGAVALMALLSLGSSAGLLPFSGVVQGTRLFTFIGYPNSAGSLAGAAFLVGLSARQTWVQRGRLPRWVYAAGQWVLLMGLLLTMSRGAWLVFPVAVAVVVALWPAGQRLALAGEMVMLGLAATVMAPLLARSFGRPLLGAAVLVVGIALAVGAAEVSRRFKALPRRRLVVAGVSAVVLAVILLGAFFLVRLAPETMAQRLGGFSLSQRSAQERIVWTRDALALVQDHPFLGSGGGAWAAQYFQYQSYSYYTTEIHNDFVELWTETGTVGFLIFLLFLGASGYAAWWLRAARPGLVAALAGGAAMLVMHSAIDFNLARGCVGIFLWGILGTLDGLYLGERDPEPKTGSIDTGGRRRKRRRALARVLPPVSARPRVLIVIVAVTLSLVALAFQVGAVTAAKARTLAQDEPLEAARLVQTACTFDPFSPAYRTELALTFDYCYRETGKVQFLEDANRQLLQAIALDPYDPNHHTDYATFAYAYGQTDLALTELEKALDLQPWEISRYIDLARLNVLIGRDLLNDASREAARSRFEEAAGVAGSWRARVAKVPAGAPAYMHLPEMTPTLALHVGQALAVLGDYEEAKVYLELALEPGCSTAERETTEASDNRRAQAALWLLAFAQEQGDVATATRLRELAGQVLPSVDRMVEEVRNLLGAAGPPA